MAAGVASVSPALLDLFGAELVSKAGPVATADALAGKDYVLLYFSASWVRECRIGFWRDPRGPGAGRATHDAPARVLRAVSAVLWASPPPFGASRSRGRAVCSAEPVS